MPWKVEITAHALEFIDESVTHPAALASIERAVEMLSAFPRMGAVYEPEYIAARPPFSCRSLPLPDTPFTLYYCLQEEHGTVIVFDIEWSAGDPRRRFESVGLV